MYYERIIEIIVILLNELKQSNQLDQKEVEMLSKMGYTQNEISTAFSWIYSKLYEGEKIFVDKPKSKNSHRFLHEVEKNIITPEAYGYIVQLRELGLINDFDIEVIIDKIMVSGYLKVYLHDIKMFIASYLLDMDDMSNTNKRITINTNDTIN
jgi:uncharacterized protein Smg (DUF494 family)